MKRQTVHISFAALTLACAALALHQGWAWQQAGKINQAVQQLTQVDDAATLKQQVEQGASGPAAPEVQLALANAWSRNGELTHAERLYNELIQQSSDPDAGQAAHFNLANRYLQEALQTGTDPRVARPLLELAKQRYRDLLRIEPQHWPARHNLEYALRLAPERPGTLEPETVDPVKSVNVVVPGFDAKNLP